MFDRRKCAPVEDDNKYSCMDDDIIIDEISWSNSDCENIEEDFVDCNNDLTICEGDDGS